MTKTYSEQQQRALYLAARSTRTIACQILDDVTNEAEFRGSTACWALCYAVRVAKRANGLEEQGHEQGTEPSAARFANGRSRDAYSAALKSFHLRLAEARGITKWEAEELTLGWLDAEQV